MRRFISPCVIQTESPQCYKITEVFWWRINYIAKRLYGIKIRQHTIYNLVQISHSSLYSSVFSKRPEGQKKRNNREYLVFFRNKWLNIDSVYLVWRSTSDIYLTLSYFNDTYEKTGSTTFENLEKVEYLGKQHFLSKDKPCQFIYIKS